jgi:hypothetical protein
MGGLDLESPLAKMLVFLRRYQSIRQRPSVLYARELEHLIVSHAGALTVPDLEKDLGCLDSGIKGFLLSAIKSGAEGVARVESPTAGLSRVTRVHCSSGRDMSCSKLLGGADSVPANVAKEDTEMAESPLFIPANMDSGYDTSETRTAPPAVVHTLGLVQDEKIAVPEALKTQISRDFFLDTITSDSPLNFCATPIRLVVQQSMETLRLLPSVTCQSRLLRFTECVESGYPDDNCKQHPSPLPVQCFSAHHILDE